MAMAVVRGTPARSREELRPYPPAGGERDLEQRVNFDGEMLQDGLALVHSSKNPFRTLCSANIEM